ncbi:putative dolichyl pyrophosphate Man9GlcNAc2 alpha-1,3-glucosyltransferase [Drosera capensis]
MKQKSSRNVGNEDNDDNMWTWLLNKGIGAPFLCISLFALVIRVAVSFHSYSGAGNPPKYGDFEAQRHWMEITVNLPANEWYLNSSSNDLSYWGLDYPPLTAYQSYIHGIFLKSILPDSVSLFTSRGHESYLGKLLMRWTVLASDILVFFPAVFFFVVAYACLTGGLRHTAWHVAVILLSPCLIIIDHGHFQYNCISLGLSLGAIAAILSDRELLACSLFCSALNHKQMSAYFAPAFFCHLLGRCLKRRNPILEIAKLGIVALGTFAVIWWPYLHSLEACLQVLSRLAPFERGLYEDYVANFWCTSSILIKWKQLFPLQSLKLLSLSATVISCLPSMIQQISTPSKHGFLYALLNSAFSFYLFSFQVHEKSILLPLLPASLLALEEPLLFAWLTHFGMLSMFPLLCRDKLKLAYIALSTLFALIYYAPCWQQHLNTKQGLPILKPPLQIALFLTSLVLHAIYVVMLPPRRYPFLFEAMIMMLCFSQFAFIAVYSNVKQWMLSDNARLADEGKKKL